MIYTRNDKDNGISWGGGGRGEEVSVTIIYKKVNTRKSFVTIFLKRSKFFTVTENVE